MNSKTEKQIAKFRDAADAMEQLVQEKLNPAVANQRITPRRAAMADSIVQEGRKLRRVQVGLRAMRANILQL